MRSPLIIAVTIFSTQFLIGQKVDFKSKLYKLEDRIIEGDLEALKEISKYIDDTTFVQEFLGYHNYPNTARGIAIRVIEENCLFTKDELEIDSSISTIKFLKLINDSNVIFDEITGMFLITQLNERTSSYQLKGLSEYDLKRLDTTVIQPPYPEWYYESQIDGFLITKNPEVLMQIASAWYKKRSRFNRYYFNDEEFLDLMKRLTKVDLGVRDGKGKTTFLYKDDYYAEARLNYLVYWVNHYGDYTWDNAKGHFANIKESAISKSEEEVLFTLLSSENDSIALDAFSRLAELDTGRVKTLADEYQRSNIDKNGSIPTFPFQFLKQMVFLTQHCRDYGIKYKADGWVLDSLNKLKADLSFFERHRLENAIILQLKLNDITSVEYFGLIYEEEWGVTFSIGRIIDKFYSLKWKDITPGRNNLELYLKKSLLFDRLGIIGNCNKYLRKFENCSRDVIDNVSMISKTTDDPDIRQQAEAVLSKYSTSITSKLKEIEFWEGSNKRYGVNDLKGQYKSIKKSRKKDDDKKDEIQELFGRISYQQLGEAIKILQSDTTMDAFDRFHLIESDFGFDIDVYDSMDIKEFLYHYFSKSEYEVYKYYLKQTGMNCLTGSDSLYYPGIYENLKYNVVDAFVGGGGSRRDDGVYLIIKLLELKFKTTLGFPKKLCSWQGMYSCDCEDRSKAWMHFLTERKLVFPDKTEPLSISNND